MYLIFESCFLNKIGFQVLYCCDTKQQGTDFYESQFSHNYKYFFWFLSPRLHPECIEYKTQKQNVNNSHTKQKKFNERIDQT